MATATGRGQGETQASMLIRACEVEGRRVDVAISRGRVVSIEEAIQSKPGASVLEARGGCLLPGLHDHHLHLNATAAAFRSVSCGPPAVANPEDLARVLSEAVPEDGWVRGAGYHESVAGPLDRASLDGFRPELPVRVQDRSGSLWSLNSAAVSALGIESAEQEGVERDTAGRPTGRLFRMDAWLRGRIGRSNPPELGPLSAELARFGVTGVTDASADNDAAFLEQIQAARARADFDQNVLVLGAGRLPPTEHDRLGTGCLKILLDEARLPRLGDLVERITAAHTSLRDVAIHAVTLAELMLALLALEEAGPRSGDRIEHASVASPEAVDWIRRLGIRVVSQPIFIHDRGDAYLKEVEDRDQPWLYLGRSWLDAGIPLAAGSDAPYGQLDPWRAMRAAIDRQTREGQPLGAAEGLRPEEALNLFLGSADAPGGAPRSIGVGCPADLCLLDRPWAQARLRPSASHVAATFCAGRLVWQAQPGFG